MANERDATPRPQGTPRTDEAEVYYSEIVTGRDGGLYWVKADFARGLEQELLLERAERAVAARSETAPTFCGICALPKKAPCAHPFCPLQCEKDVCRLAKPTGIKCADDECDIAAGTRALPSASAKPTPEMISAMDAAARSSSAEPVAHDWNAHEQAEVLKAKPGTLTKPAMVGGTRFGVGISERTVIERAQREYEYQVTPEKEAARIAKGNAAMAALSATAQPTPDFGERDQAMAEWVKNVAGPAATKWIHGFQLMPVLPPNAEEGFKAGAAWARTAMDSRGAGS